LTINLQRVGPKHLSIAADLLQIDAIVCGLIDFFQKQSIEVIILSEYGITEVDMPISLNRLFRKKAGSRSRRN
jgi:hypothetical protein